MTLILIPILVVIPVIIYIESEILDWLR